MEWQVVEEKTKDRKQGGWAISNLIPAAV